MSDRRTRSSRPTRPAAAAATAANTTQKKKPNKSVKPKAPLLRAPVAGLEVENKTINDVILSKENTFPFAIIHGLWDTTQNHKFGLESLYHVLTQAFHGHSDKDRIHEIEQDVCTFVKTFRATSVEKKTLRSMLKNTKKEDLCFHANTNIYVHAACIFYQVNIVLFIKDMTTDEYTTVRMETRKGQSWYCIHYDSVRYELMTEKHKKRVSTIDKEYEIEKIVTHAPKSLVNLDNVKFVVKWKGYDSSYNLQKSFDDLLDTEALHAYIEKLPTSSRGIKHALQLLKAYKEKPDQSSDDEDDPLLQKHSGHDLTKNTGKKMTVVGDSLKLRGKGGVYAVLPYEQLDDKNKAIFKIGMTTNYIKRFEQMHLYFPEGVYFVNILSDPEVPEWTKKQITQWKKEHNAEPPSMQTKKSLFYKSIEEFIFNYVEDHGAKRIYATTRVIKPDSDDKGITEWVYTNEDIIHEAFVKAHETFIGGKLQTFYLHGLDPDTNEEVESINVLAQQRSKELPNFTGKVIFRM